MPKKSSSAPVAPENTKYLDRLIEALTLLCGGKVPPREMVHAWESSDDEELQSWAACNTTLPWAMGIGTIEAAQVLADNPEEGMGHELRYEAYPGPEQEPAPRTEAADLVERVTEVFGDDWSLRLTPGGTGDLTVPGGLSYFNSSEDLDDLLANPNEDAADPASPAQ
jgi:hypothetical protein